MAHLYRLTVLYTCYDKPNLAFLQDNHDIETLDLEGNWIEKEGASHIADTLRENIYLTDVVCSQTGSSTSENMPVQ